MIAMPYKHTNMSTPAAAPENPLQGKYNQLWGVVKEKPEDFNTWSTLLSTVDKLVSKHAVAVARVRRFVC